LYLPATFLSVAATGCATMMFGTTETIRIYSEPPGAIVTLPNGNQVITPAEVELDRKSAFVITIAKEGYETETVTLQPVFSGKGLAFGGLYDYESGAVYQLTPNPVSVVLKPTDRKLLKIS